MFGIPNSTKALHRSIKSSSLCQRHLLSKYMSRVDAADRSCQLSSTVSYHGFIVCWIFVSDCLPINICNRTVQMIVISSFVSSRFFFLSFAVIWMRFHINETELHVISCFPLSTDSHLCSVNLVCHIVQADILHISQAVFCSSFSKDPFLQFDWLEANNN